MIWTDYTASALLYECYRVEADKRCSTGADHITVLSRTNTMADDTFDMLMQKVQPCFNIENSHKVRYLNVMGLSKL